MACNESSHLLPESFAPFTAFATIHFGNAAGFREGWELVQIPKRLSTTDKADLRRGCFTRKTGSTSGSLRMLAAPLFGIHRSQPDYAELVLFSRCITKLQLCQGHRHTKLSRLSYLAVGLCEKAEAGL